MIAVKPKTNGRFNFSKPTSSQSTRYFTEARWEGEDDFTVCTPSAPSGKRVYRCGSLSYEVSGGDSYGVIALTSRQGNKVFLGVGSVPDSKSPCDSAFRTCPADRQKTAYKTKYDPANRLVMKQERRLQVFGTTSYPKVVEVVHVKQDAVACQPVSF